MFFILSGFLMIYNYYDRNRIEAVSFKENLMFAWHKIKYLYPVHVATTLAMVIFMFIGESREPILRIILKVFLNLLLLQEWIPMDGGSINVVSWYFCATVFLYFVFPYILRYIEKGYSINKAQKMLVILWIIQIMGDFLASRLLLFNHAENIWMREDIWVWFIYYFPPIRALDFAIGCNLGYCFLHSKSSMMYASKYTLFELVTLALTVLASVSYVMVRPREEFGEKILYSHPEIWWTHTIIFTVSSCMIVWMFAKGGDISKCLVNRITLYLGNISQFTFLIHLVVLRYMDATCNLIFESEFNFYYGGWIKLFFGFILTLIAMHVWRWITFRFHDQNRKKNFYC